MSQKAIFCCKYLHCLGAAHEVTIVMFSRVFYQAKELAEFPDHMRHCLQRVSGINRILLFYEALHCLQWVSGINLFPLFYETLSAMGE